MILLKIKFWLIKRLASKSIIILNAKIRGEIVIDAKQKALIANNLITT